MTDHCPNCDERRDIWGRFPCLCTFSEQERAIRILRRQEREELKRVGKRVLVDDSGAGADHA